MEAEMGRRAIDTRKKIKIGTRTMFLRIFCVFAVIICAAMFLVGRIFYLNKTKGKTYERKVKKYMIWC